MANKLLFSKPVTSIEIPDIKQEMKKYEPIINGKINA